MLNEDLRLEDILNNINPVNQNMLEQARAYSSKLIMPPRALGRLHDIAEQICAIQGNLQPDVRGRTILVFVGDHGVFQENISAFPQVVTLEMVRCFLRGGAGINVISKEVGADVQVVDMGIIPDIGPEYASGPGLQICKQGRGTQNLAKGPAMSRAQAIDCVLTGFELASRKIKGGSHLLGTGDMGIGNTTPAAAMGSVFTGCSPAYMSGPGTGLQEQGVRHKTEVIEQSLRVNKPLAEDGLDVLAKVGGFEIGAVSGCILAGALHRVPVVIDGFISTAGALLAQALHPETRGYIFAGHCSQEPGHALMLQHMQLEPLLCLDMRLGEGTGGALAMSVIQTAVSVFNEVFTFQEGQVSEKENKSGLNKQSE